MNKKLKRIVIIISILILSIFTYFLLLEKEVINISGNTENLENDEVIAGISIPSNSAERSKLIREHRGYSVWADINSSTEIRDYANAVGNTGIKDISTVLNQLNNAYNNDLGWYYTLAKNTSVYCNKRGQPLPSIEKKYLDGFHINHVDTNNSQLNDTVQDFVEYHYAKRCSDKTIKVISSNMPSGDNVDLDYTPLRECDVGYGKEFIQHTCVRLEYSSTPVTFDTARSYIFSYSLRNFYKFDIAQLASWEYNQSLNKSAGTDLKNAGIAVKELSNPVKPKMSKGTNTGTVIDGLNYKVGPIHMNDYTFGWCSDAKNYSGELICGITEAVAELDNGQKITLNASNFSFNPTAQERKGNYWRVPKASDGYFYPTPNSDFYILLPYNSKSVIGATKITKITMKYKYTIAEGAGWKLTGNYDYLTWKGKNDQATLSNCTYHCTNVDENGISCKATGLSTEGRSARIVGNTPYTNLNEHSHDFICGGSGYCNACSSNNGFPTSCMGHKGSLNCGNEIHTHTKKCKLNCNYPENSGHTHIENCYGAGYYCGKIEHIHKPWNSVGDHGCYSTKYDPNNYCEHGHVDGKHNSKKCVSWGKKHTDDCYGEEGKGTICDHNHSTCYILNWTVDKVEPVTAQELLAVKQAQVHEKTLECYIANIPLVTKVEVNKYIYDVNHNVKYDGYDSTMAKGNNRSILNEEQKKKNPVYVEFGDLVTYKIEVKNYSAFGVKVRAKDIIPQNNACTLITANIGNQKTNNINDIIIEISEGNTVSFTVTVKVEKTNGSYVNVAKLISRNNPKDKDYADYVRTIDDNGPIVNHSDVKCNGTTNEPKITSEDWYILNDYTATLDKYINSYDKKVMLENNNNTFTTEESKITDRYSMTEQEKSDRPLQVEKGEKVEYAIRITNEAKEVKSSVYGTTKKIATVRPTEIIDTLQTGLKYKKVYARVYTSNGKDKYNQDIKINVKNLENNTYQFTIENYTSDGKMIMLDPEEYIIYYVTVEITESNMYLYKLQNTAILKVLTNVNDIENKDDREVQNDNGVNENKSIQQVSSDYVKMKDLVISGKVWLDRDKDGLMDLNQHGKFDNTVDASANASTHIEYPEGSSEYAMKNIVVKLYSVGTGPNGTDTLVRTTKTDENGLFTFGKKEDGTSWYNGVYSYDGSVTESEQRIDKATGKDANKNYTNDSKLIQYYIEYLYDGLVYKSTEIYAGNSHLDEQGRIDSEGIYKIDSNATEFEIARKEFDDKYEVIAFDKGYNVSYDRDGNLQLDGDSLSYEKNGHNSWINANNLRGQEDENGTGIMTARSFIDTDTQKTNYLWLYKQSNAYQLPETEYLKYINLGLEEREDVDISITHDVYEVKTTVNGEEMTYEYNQNDYTLGNESIDKAQINDESYNSELYMTGYVSDNSSLTPYKFVLYSSDYNYKVSQYNIDTVKDYKGTESELNVETTFRIRVTNNSITDDEPYLDGDRKDIKVYTGINEIAQYYDTEFVDLDFNEDGSVKTFNIKTKDENGYLVNTPLKVAKAEYVLKDGTRHEAYLSKTSLYNTENGGTRVITDNVGTPLYKTLYIRPKEGTSDLLGNTVLAEGESLDILITFESDKEDIDNELYVYIGDKINVAEISAYSTYYKDNRGRLYPAGLVDKDSNPGNFGELYGLNATKDVNSAEYLALYEDDTFKTGITILAQLSDRDRKLDGFVWDDSRSEIATKEDGSQYIGDGKYDTTVNAKEKQPDAKRNQSVSNKEETDITIQDMKVQLVEMITIPIKDVNGNVIEERVYEETIKVNGDQSVVDTLTSEEGKYQLEGYIPGNYIVKFFYGNDENLDNMLIFNGQDYKSTTYQATESVYAENKSSSDEVLATLEKSGISDAKDDEIRRLEVISYSETMNNQLNNILRGKNTSDKNALVSNTNMHSETTTFLVRAEKEKSDKKILTYEETLAKFDISKERHPIKNIDFGIEYRPELQVSLNKYISNITITTSDANSESSATPLVDAKFNEYYGIVVETDMASGATEFLVGNDGNIVKVSRYANNTEIEEAVKTAGADISKCQKTNNGTYIVTLAGTTLDTQNSVGLSNLQYVENMYEKDSEGKLFVYDKYGYIKTEQGFVYLNIDDELMQGATISVKYVFAGNNLSEIDRVSSNLSELRFKENEASLEYRDKQQPENYYNQVQFQQGTNNSLIDANYSGAMTARNKLFSEYYGYELDGDNIKTYTNKYNNNQVNNVTYRIKTKTIDVDDKKKLDYDTTYFGRYLGSLYYIGVIGEKDIVAELKIDKILDYIDNDLVFDNSKNNSTNNLWKTTTSKELLDSSLVSSKSFIDIGTSDGELGIVGLSGKYLLDSKNRVYDTTERSNLALLLDDRIKDYKNPEEDITVNKDISKYLSPRNSYGANSFGTVSLVASKVISAEDLSEDMNYENVGEIIQYSSVAGRVTPLATTLGDVRFFEIDENGDPKKDSKGNLIPVSEWDESRKQSDTGATEQITLTPPTGLGKMQQIVRNTVEGASYIVIVIIAVAVVVLGYFVGVKLYRKRRIK